MSYVAIIRRNADGLIRKYVMDGCNYEDDGTLSLWTEGNCACDCNRYLFFRRAASESEDDVVDCGRTAYTVLGLELPDGRCVVVHDVEEVY